MKLGLQLRLKQTLAPQLIQSLKMLQMPLLKLEQTLRHELAINPLLEEVEELEVETEQEDQEFDLTKEAEPEEEKASEVDWDDYFFDEDEGYRARDTREDREEQYESTASSQSENLYDHLLEQLAFVKLSEVEQLIGEYIIGNIGPDGYLAISVAEMAVELGIEQTKIDEILAIIQRFDPVGVASRDLAGIAHDPARRKGTGAFAGLPNRERAYPGSGT